DYMEGGTGADIYYIYTGDGNDVIYNYDNTASRADDRLVFGSGIRAGAMSLSRNGNDLLITNTATSQVTTIRSGFSGDYYQLNNLEFDDATATIDYKETRLNIRYRTVTRVDDTILEDAVIVKDEDILTDTSDVIYETDVIREAETLTVINDTDILEASGNAIDTVIREDMTDRTGGDILVADILLEEPQDKEISKDNIVTDSVETVVNEDVLREDILTVQSTDDDVTVNRTEQDEEKESIFTETLTEERTTEGTTEVAAEPVRSIDSIVEASINAMHEASDGDVPVQDGNNDTYETADASFASDETSVDQIVEVMVQEMSEPSGSAVSESEVIRTETDSTSTEQLWSE
nr:hypothetical protein [Lachnospiraceae bacterium]